MASLLPLQIRKEFGDEDSTTIKSGRGPLNHNEALKVRSTVKAGGSSYQHNETLRVRSTIKSGGGYMNHNEVLKVRTSLKGGRKAGRGQLEY